MNRLARLLLTGSSIAPVCVTLIFIGYMNHNSWLIYTSLITAIISWLLCLTLITVAKKKFEPLSKNINSISPANREVTNYFLSYLFPLLGIDSIAKDPWYAIFFYSSLLIYISFSENYNFNPVLALHGYKFYEAEDNTGVGFILISKEIIINIKDVKFEVVKLTEHTFLHIQG